MRCFIVGTVGDRDRSAVLEAAATGLGYTPVSINDLGVLGRDSRFREESRPLVLVADGADTSAQAAVDFAQHQGGRIGVIYVADQMPPDLYKRLVRTRSGEWITWRNAAAELADVVAALGAVADRERSGKVVSFVGCKGGVGNTTIAVETAVIAAERRARGAARAALFDLDLQGGTVAAMLDVEARFDLGEIDGRPERLDEQLIDVFTSRHASGLDVFASPPRRGGAREPDPQIVFAFLDGLSRRYDAVFLDVPYRRSAWTDNLLRGSDRVVVTGIGQVPALRLLVADLARLRELGVPDAHVGVVLNLCSTDLIGRFLHRAEIERSLAGYSVLFVRRDHVAIGGAADLGRSIAETTPRSRVAGDIRRLTEWVDTAADRGAAR